MPDNTLYIDQPIENADSIKSRWPYDSVGESIEYVVGQGTNRQRHQTFNEFLKFPVMRFMPDKVRAALDQMGFHVPDDIQTGLPPVNIKPSGGSLEQEGSFRASY